MYILSFIDVIDSVSSFLSILSKSFLSSINFIMSIFVYLPKICISMISLLPSPLSYLVTGFIGCLVIISVMKILSLILSSIKIW